MIIKAKSETITDKLRACAAWIARSQVRKKKVELAELVSIHHVFYCWVVISVPLLSFPLLISVPVGLRQLLSGLGPLGCSISTLCSLGSWIGALCSLSFSIRSLLSVFSFKALRSSVDLCFKLRTPRRWEAFTTERRAKRRNVNRHGVMIDEKTKDGKEDTTSWEAWLWIGVASSMISSNLLWNALACSLSEKCELNSGSRSPFRFLRI